MDDSAPESVNGPQPPWLRRHRLLLIVVAALLLLYTLGGFLLLPHLARNEAIDYVQQDLGAAGLDRRAGLQPVYLNARDP